MVQSSSDEEPESSPPPRSIKTSQNIAQRVLQMIKELCLGPDQMIMEKKRVDALTKLRRKVIPGQAELSATKRQKQGPSFQSLERPITRASTRSSTQKRAKKWVTKRKRSEEEPIHIDLDDVAEAEVVVSREKIVGNRRHQVGRIERAITDEKFVKSGVSGEVVEGEIRETLRNKEKQVSVGAKTRNAAEDGAAIRGVCEDTDVVTPACVEREPEVSPDDRGEKVKSPIQPRENEQGEATPYLDWEMTEGWSDDENGEVDATPEKGVIDEEW